MRSPIIDLDKLIGLFSFFVVGTLSISVYFLLHKTTTPLVMSLINSLILIFIFTYEFVILSLIVHYIEKKKKLAIESIKIHPIRYTTLIVLVGLIIYGIVIYLKDGNILGTMEKIIYIFLILLGGLLVQLIISHISKKFTKKEI